ncbi:hypothetical protein ROZALSC1DRAFT_26123, partial [Rozella allomycis CSF55]
MADPSRLHELLAWLIAISIFYIVPIMLIYLRREHPLLKVRMVPLMMQSMISGLAVTINTVLTLKYFENTTDYPCIARMVLTSYLIPLWLYSYMFRALYLICMN